MNKVSLIGKGRCWEEAPLEGLSWGITQLILRRPVDRVIDMNDYTLWGSVEAEEADQAKALAAERGVEYIDRSNYPLNDVIEFFDTDYFSNTVDYSIALALIEGYDEIHLYGVNMEVGSEYIFEKAGVEFWIGMALGRGIKVIVHGQYSTIMRTKDGLLYGYGSPQRERFL
uniref:Uncharacterized protein n=1 Tax=viral metagenome TaxID=1070528 RepID=A0A6M3J494_9ZZZZ